MPAESLSTKALTKVELTAVMTGDEIGRAVVAAGTWTAAGTGIGITGEEEAIGATRVFGLAVARGAEVGAAVAGGATGAGAGAGAGTGAGAGAGLAAT
jgi:hypothetical protein